MRLFRELLLGPSFFLHKRLIKKAYSSACQKSIQDVKGDILSKDHYRRNLSRLSFFARYPLCKLITTGGTSGQPFEFYLDTFSRRQKERAYIFDVWAAVGYRPFDLRVVFRANITEKLISFNCLDNSWNISPNLCTQDTRSEVRDFLINLPPFFLHCSPSSFFSLFEFVGWNLLSQIGIRGVLAGSELFPVEQIKYVEDDLGIPVAHWYGHSEYAIFAKYCSECEGFHFYPTYGDASLLASGDDVNLKKLIASSKNRIGTVFKNYDTGDWVRVSSKSCSACSFPRVDSIIGREQEFLIDINGARVAVGPLLFGFNNEFWSKIFSIQFQQNEAGTLNVLLVLVRPDDQAWLEKVLSERFTCVSLTFKVVMSIPKTISGKHKYFISNI